MKWLAVLFILLNLGVWYCSSTVQAPTSSGAAAGGQLPRVSSLKAQPPTTKSEAKPVEAPEPEPDAAVASSAQALSCARVGWFEARELAQANELAGNLDGQVQEVERDLAPLHWVIIPPQPREVALKQFQEIQRQGVDSYLVTEGENRNAISLGLFESREAAISVLEEKKRQNLNVVLANFPRNQISYALVFEADPELIESTVRAVETAYGENFDFIEINPCESVATPKKSP
ncbi:hypothetical protein D777_00352 [Marinobacter nitratireducens]|uniref:SPOR domain-containing protein n=1 Tax=Marinobacter nitratireducens TaxID=1137280 RepID=A0A072MWQ8_9GAMM|nr:hypothetical protein [Marinobacter nitratireducens]KEF29686.1 hypothetical protein D777_00352 [Marinobacter nitratireducens]